jgi:Ca2+-binding EF-hand superfamily protein
MFDNDQSSTVDFNEFKSLWHFITQWEKVFRGFDEDRSGSIDKEEFRKALTSFGNQRKKTRKRMIGYLHIFTFRLTNFCFRKPEERDCPIC